MGLQHQGLPYFSHHQPSSEFIGHLLCTGAGFYRAHNNIPDASVSPTQASASEKIRNSSLYFK